MSDTPDVGALIDRLDSALQAGPLEGDAQLELEKALRELRIATERSEDLRRYRETRQRMGRTYDLYLVPPNFAYTIHSSC